jgi:CubicO group peptidase (beta-lactamase class C family)
MTAIHFSGQGYMQYIKGMMLLGAILMVGTFVVPRVWDVAPEYGTALPQGELNPQVRLALAQMYRDAADHDRAMIAVNDGRVVYQSGDTAQIMNVHSNRKAIISVLYGIAVDKGLIDLNKTLAQLHIDEVTPLTSQEKSATIRDLLMSRSGIFLPGKGEHDAQITNRPERGSHLPGTYFFHNNFDYNALGSILVQETGYSIGEFMETYLAKPLGMQDFTRNNVVMGDPWFYPSGHSQHEMYNIYMSTRDHAKIGMLVAQGGQWNGRQLVSRSWIELSTSALSDLKASTIDYGRYDASGYIWWLDEDTQTVWSDGVGGHFMLIDCKNQLVLVERNFTGNSLLTTGLWLANIRPTRDSPADLIKAHRLMVEADDVATWVEK